MCLSNIEVIGQSMAEILCHFRFLKTRGHQNSKVGHVTPHLDAV